MTGDTGEAFQCKGRAREEAWKDEGAQREQSTAPLDPELLEGLVAQHESSS